MSFNRFSFLRFALWMVLLAVGYGTTHAQSPRPNVDSMRRANAARIDSMRAAREAATKVFKDAQQRRTDSLTALRKYRESKRYTDSVARIRQARTDSSRAVQKTRTDSLTTTRNKARDSLTSARNVVMTEMRATQKKRSDSLNARKTYRESKRYADSVEVMRKVKTDSLQASRKAFADRTKAERAAIASALTAARKKTADSLKAIRKKTSDSLMAFRKQRSDSVAAVRAIKDKAAKGKEEAKTKKAEWALNIKMSKKREKWSNESMLKKRWGPPRKQLQNLFTHYNYYYNANRKMEMAEENMLRVKKDSYDKPIDLFPFNPDTDSSLLLADMDSIVQKTSVGIQIHDPRTDWADEMYLLLGQAYYYKGSYDNAAIAFRYIISLRELKKKEQARNSGSSSTRGKTPSILQDEKKSALDFLKHQSVHNDALLWLARTFTQTGRYGEAESVLDLLINDPNFPPSLKGRYSVEAANLALKTGHSKEAPAHLIAVAEDKSMVSWQRQRASFLAGQLLYEQGKYGEAAAAFAKTIDLNPKIDMDFQARKNRAYAVMASGVASEETIAALRKMLKDNKYAPYYEQVYYVLGKIYANSGDRPMAIQYLNQSLRAPKTTKAQKALSFLALGDVYYADGQYNPAQISYDSAAYLAGKDAVTKAPFDVAAQRAKSLAAVAGPARLVAAQDSLLALSNLSEKEQRAVVKKYLKLLSTRKADSASRAAAGADNNTMALPTGDGNDINGNSSNDWYFASATTMQQGYADFRRKWGNRTLADNWRRASANAANMANNNAGQAAGATSSGDTTTANTDTVVASDGPTERSLLALIPRTDEARDAVRGQLQKSMLTLAGAYAKDVQDYPRAMKTLDAIDRRFPEPKYPDESLYLGYLIYLRQNQIERAQMLAQQLLEKYPASSYAALVRPADDEAGPLMTGSVEASSYYEETYNLVQKRSYTEALRRSRDGQKRWTDPRLNERFRMLEIMALSGNSEYNKADSMAGKFITTTANDSLRTWAQTVQDFIRANKPRDTARPTASLAPTPTTSTPALRPAAMTPNRAADSVATRLDSTATRPPVPTATIPAPAPIPASYTYSTAAPHVFAFVFSRMEAKVMGVKAGLGDLNTFQYSGQGLQTQIQNLPGGKGLILVKGFSNLQKAKAYEQTFKATPVLTKEFRAGEVKTFLISEDNLRKLAAEGDMAAYEAFYRRSYR